VFCVWSAEFALGDTVATITTRACEEVKLSRSTRVSLEARNGTCTCPPPPPLSVAARMARARMHSFSASSDLLISALSMRRCWLWLRLSAARSEPARSTREMEPCTRPSLLRSVISQMACEREDWLFISVACVARAPLPRSMRSSSSSGDPASSSSSPLQTTRCRASSRIVTLARPCSRSTQRAP
jgi:hypothetical protein